jgi:hypothetical protein
VQGHVAVASIDDYGHAHHRVVLDLDKELFLDVELLHYVHTVANESFVAGLALCRVLILNDKTFAAHFLSDVGDLVHVACAMNGTLETTFFELTDSSIVDLDLSFHDKVTVVVCPKLPRHDSRLFLIKCKLPNRDRNAVLVQHLSSLVLMHHHVSERIPPHE